MASLQRPLCVQLLTAAVLLSAAVNTAAQSSKDVNRLLSKVANMRPGRIRPVKNASDPVTVSVAVGLIDLISLDESNGILHAKLQNHYSWKDVNVEWDPEDFGGLMYLRLSSTDMWQPDLSILNEYEATETVSTRVLLDKDGKVVYTPPMRTKTSCPLDLTYFPFDIQTCDIRIGSWVYEEALIDVQLNGEGNMDLSGYGPNPEWTLLDTEGRRDLFYYDCCPERYPSLTFRMTLQRKASYYTYVYLGPAVILSLLVPFIFLLPPGNQQKVTLGVGILVCLTLFFVAMRSNLPRMHIFIPLIDKFYMTTYVLVSLSMALTALVANLAERAASPSRPPALLSKVMLGCLGRCLCIGNSDKAGEPTEEQPTDIKTDAGAGSGAGTGPGEGVAAEGGLTQWQLIAAVMDRLFFLTFLLMAVLVPLCILTSRPRA